MHNNVPNSAFGRNKNLPDGTNQFFLYGNSFDNIENIISRVGQNACSDIKGTNDQISVNIKLENEIKTLIRQSSLEGAQIKHCYENNQISKTTTNNLLTLGKRVNQKFSNIPINILQKQDRMFKDNESYTISVTEIVEVVQDVNIIEVPEHLLKDKYVREKIINQSEIYTYSTSYENNINLRKLSNLQINEKKKNGFNVQDLDMQNIETGRIKNPCSPVEKLEKQSFIDLTIQEDSVDNFNDFMEGMSNNEVKGNIDNENKIVENSNTQFNGNSYLEKNLEDPNNNFLTFKKKICENFKKKFVINQESLKKINDQKLFEKGLQILINKYSKLDEGSFQFQKCNKRCFPVLPLDKWIQTIRNKIARNSEYEREKEVNNILLRDRNPINKPIDEFFKRKFEQDSLMNLRSKRVLTKRKKVIGRVN